MNFFRRNAMTLGAPEWSIPPKQNIIAVNVSRLMTGCVHGDIVKCMMTQWEFLWSIELYCVWVTYSEVPCSRSKDARIGEKKWSAWCRGGEKAKLHHHKSFLRSPLLHNRLATVLQRSLKTLLCITRKIPDLQKDFTFWPLHHHKSFPGHPSPL